jgi:GTP cyclohydrolase I
MVSKGKTSKELGLEVEAHLKKLGIETPMCKSLEMTSDAQIAALTGLFTKALEVLGLNLEDDSLCDTPKRIAKMWVNEIFYGLKPENFPKCTQIENKMNYDELVIVRDINVQSNCEHHFVVIDGKAWIGYIPNKTVIGLSKINRIVEYFAKRPQVQERLTEQIWAALSLLLGTEDVAVVIAANHYCVKSRGVEDVCSDTVTSKMGGKFKDKNNDLRKEFLTLLELK